MNSDSYIGGTVIVICI